MPFNSKYYRVLATANYGKWKLTVFNFITLVGADVLDEPIGEIDGDPVFSSEMDPFEYSIKPESVELTILQKIDASHSIFKMSSSRDYWTTYSPLSTKPGLFLEVHDIGSGSKQYYKERPDLISRRVKNDGTQFVKLTFYNGISECENLKQWNEAGTARNSAWTNIFQASVRKTIPAYIEALCAGSIDADFGSFSVSKRYGMKFRRTGSTTDHGIDNIYILGDFFLTGTSVSNTLHKTGADVLKDIMKSLGLTFQWHGLNKLAYYQIAANYSSEAVTVKAAGTEFTEEPLFFSLSGIVHSMKDQASTPHWFNDKWGTVPLNAENGLVDSKNTRQLLIRIYNDMSANSFSPGCALYIGEPVGTPTNYYAVTSVDGQTRLGFALLYSMYLYDAGWNNFYQTKKTSLKAPTFGAALKVNFAGKITFPIVLNGVTYNYEGKVYKLKRTFKSQMDDFDVYSTVTII